MNDLISRQAVLDFPIRIDHYDKKNGNEIFVMGIETVMEYVEQLPPIQPKQKKGRWIKAKGMMPPEFHGHHCCSECGDFASMDVPYGNRENLSNYCPSCGADMRGEQDDK